jgi:hypothetical protein
MSNKKHLILHNYYQTFNHSNRAFDESAQKIGANLHRWALSLRENLCQLGCEINTADRHPHGHAVDAVVFMDFPDHNDHLAKKLLSIKTKHYLITNESPIIRPQNFFPEHHQSFDAIFTYNRDIVDNARVFELQPYGFSLNDIRHAVNIDYFDKALVCAIAGNKSNPGGTELYNFRKADYLALSTYGRSTFEVYGKQWESERVNHAGLTVNKYETLSKYRFSLCYENTTLRSWYISEKLFDVICAGTVPVYAGPSEIERLLPPEAVILRSRFGTVEELLRYLHEITPEDHARYLRAGTDWLRSGHADRWRIEKNTERLAAFLSNDLRSTDQSRHWFEAAYR